ncbi:sulfatase-like hydrolase/transferase, partial [Oleiphilus sp. HI0066]
MTFKNLGFLFLSGIIFSQLTACQDTANSEQASVAESVESESVEKSMQSSAGDEAAVKTSAAVPLQQSEDSTPVQQAETSSGKPNILVIWGDDIGWSNVSAYNHSVMGYGTPNIDRIANEGVMFSDHYAQPSCTAGRAAFITGQYPIRSGMTTVGQPGDALGLQKESPSLAEVLKEEGYRTGHFGKNHLGDRNEHLPTMHGFEEFYGNLYHLNTQEEAEQRDYQNFGKAF